MTITHLVDKLVSLLCCGLWFTEVDEVDNISLRERAFRTGFFSRPLCPPRPPLPLAGLSSFISEFTLDRLPLPLTCLLPRPLPLPLTDCADSESERISSSDISSKPVPEAVRIVWACFNASCTSWSSSFFFMRSSLNRLISTSIVSSEVFRLFRCSYQEQWNKLISEMTHIYYVNN